MRVVAHDPRHAGFPVALAVIDLVKQVPELVVELIALLARLGNVQRTIALRIRFVMGVIEAPVSMTGVPTLVLIAS